MRGILDGFAATGDDRAKTLAYGLATARREVGAGMVPVREGFKKTDAEACAYVLRHYPTKYGRPAGRWGHVYYGRGYVQLTWLKNYEREGVQGLARWSLERRCQVPRFLPADRRP